MMRSLLSKLIREAISSNLSYARISISRSRKLCDASLCLSNSEIDDRLPTIILAWIDLCLIRFLSGFSRLLLISVTDRMSESQRVCWVSNLLLYRWRLFPLISCTRWTSKPHQPKVFLGKLMFSLSIHSMKTTTWKLFEMYCANFWRLTTASIEMFVPEWACKTNDSKIWKCI